MKINWSKKMSWLGAAFAIGAVLLVANLVGEFFGLNKNSWPGWVQAIGSVGAISVAVWIFNKQQLHDRAKAEDADAAAVLSLQMVANELARLCTMSMYQASEQDAPLIYPDLPREFSAMIDLLGRMPTERLAVRNCIFILLDLRRVAVEFEALMKTAPAPGLRNGEFFRAHRTTVFNGIDRCRKHAIVLAELVNALSNGKLRTADQL